MVLQGWLGANTVSQSHTKWSGIGMYHGTECINWIQALKLIKEERFTS